MPSRVLAGGDLTAWLRWSDSRSGAISREQFAAEMASLRTTFEKIVQELTREAKSAALVAMASLKVVYPLRASSRGRVGTGRK